MIIDQNAFSQTGRQTSGKNKMINAFNYFWKPLQLTN